jgi:hypothetical protein
MKKKIMSNVLNYDFIRSRVDLIAQTFEENLRNVEENEINKDKK